MKILTKVLIAITAFGGVLFAYGYHQSKVLDRAGQAPSEVTIQQLQVRSELRNLHVTLRKHVASYKDVAFIAAGGKLDHVYYPALSHWPKKGAKVDPAKRYRVLIKTRRFKDRKAIEKLPNYRTMKPIQGMVITRFEKTSAAEDDRLLRAFKGIDLSKVTVLEEGRVPPKPSDVYGLMLAGGAIVIFSLHLLIRRRRR